MHLTRLEIHTLPGIEPGFQLQPAATGVNIVIGPNASGKSSLIRALAHLLQPHTGDPPALSLEAEFHSKDASWQVRRNGSQVAWTRNGEAADRPALPAAGQIGMYRLAMEHLLADDQGDQDIARELLHTLHGGFDLSEPRMALTTRFANAEATALRQAQAARQEVERRYEGLRQQEAGLPDLNAAIANAENAQSRCERLHRIINLHRAIRQRKNKAEELRSLPPGMDKLLGNEIDRLRKLEARLQHLRTELQSHHTDLAARQAELKRSGLEKSRPKPEEIAANEAHLQRIRDQSVEREHAERQLAAAEAAVRDAIAHCNGHELAPSLNAQDIQRSEAIAGPMLLAQAQKSELEQRLALAGNPPQQSEIDCCRAGVGALRMWLAISDASERPQEQEKGGWRSALPLWVVLGAAAIAGLAALLQNAFAALAGAVAAIVAALWALRTGQGTKGPSSSEDARRRFTETGLDPPAEWIRATVRVHLRAIENRLNNLLLQQERAANANAIRNQIKEAEQELARLNEDRRTFVKEAGFDPNLPIAAFDRFVRLSVQWDQARQNCVRQKAEIDRLDGQISGTAKQVGEFIAQWKGEKDFESFAPGRRVDADTLRSAFNALKERVEAAIQAQGDIETVQGSICATQHGIASAQDDINRLFGDAGLAGDGVAMPANASGGAGEWAKMKRELVRRLEKRAAWEPAKKQLTEAETEEKRIRRLLKNHPDLDKPANSKADATRQAARQHLAKCLRWARTGAIHQLERERDESAAQAKALEHLRAQRTKTRTMLDNAGKDRALENALNQEMHAQAALEDRRDEAFLSEATHLLLDDVQQAFQTEHEPVVLRRARSLFREVTSHAFDFELGTDGQFMARDLEREASRTLSELSSGTRMQLLLALRLAWMQTQEQGASPLPLFLDEALTTSDEGRFKVMAQSLERLSESAGRQIFYLSARRHEPALWRQATGRQPAVADLAAIRFGAEGSEPNDYAVETPPPPADPDGRTPAAYAALLGVPQYDPRTAAGGIHLFHLLRDELNLLHHLLDAWRLKSLGQLEALLSSSAAQGAIGDANQRQRLLNRCSAARHWAELWRQGRGKPVDRSALERSGAVTSVFIDRATDLAAALGGNGQTLIAALRDGRLSRFHTSNIDILEQWLTDQGHIDARALLAADHRRRLALQHAQPQSSTQAKDVNQLVDWLEAALDETALNEPAR